MLREMRGTALALALIAGGCGAGDEPAESTGDDEAPPAALVPGDAAPADTSAEALWAHLQTADYRQSWRLWPGMGEFYPGTEPHGLLLTTRVNAAAYDALTTGAPELPDGALIVKDNFAPDSTLVATTVMFRRRGYDPANGDWFWLKRLADGTTEVAGRVEACAACHAQAPGGAMLYTPLPGGGD